MCYSCHMIRVHTAGEVEELRDCLIKKIGIDNFERLKESAYKVSDFSEEFLESLLKVKMLQFTELCNVYQDRTLQLPSAGLAKLEKARKIL